MESRVDKYSSNKIPSRSTRNARLYKEVYGKYDDLNNLPLEDNADEIDINRLKEILHNNEGRREKNKEAYYFNSLEEKKRNIDEKRVYDINKILEKAKYENNKLKETAPLSKIDTSILSTLQNREVSVDEITIAKKSHDKEVNNNEKDFSMTRELKFKGLSEMVQGNPLMEHVMPDNELSLELFSDLKPTENTITTKPIQDTVKIKEIPKENKEIDVHSGDTKDIDIIKEPNNKEDVSDFFTSSYEFSDSDFFDEPVKKNGIFKIILLVLAIIVFAGVIAYFVLNYGIGT